METLPSRFPDAKGFYQFEIKGGDLTPMLNEVKRFSERRADILDNYLRNGFPLALAASTFGKSSIEFAGTVIRRGELLRTCVGTSEERIEAIRSIRDAADRGVVLDTYTAWVAYSLGLVPVLKSMFARVAIPQSSLDELRQWRDQYQPSADGEPLMTIGYAEGQYFREEISNEQVTESIATIKAGITALQSELEILPTFVPSITSGMQSALLEMAPHGFLDAIHISAEQNLLLLSDDFHYRTIARSVHERTGVWLQPVLMCAADAGKMTGPAYARAVADLSIQKHDHVSLNALTLIEIVKLDDTEGLRRFKAAVEFIGTPTAELESHFSVSWAFLKAIWTTRLPFLRQSAAAGAILERLTQLLARNDQLASGYQAMIRECANRPVLRDYLIAWARGHFLGVV